jgi:hypothetical protein
MKYRTASLAQSVGRRANASIAGLLEKVLATRPVDGDPRRRKGSETAFACRKAQELWGGYF